MGNTIVGCFSKALLRGSYDRWNLKVRARKCAAVVAFCTPEPLRVEEE
jgi:hypothetical protein